MPNKDGTPTTEEAKIETLQGELDTMREGRDSLLVNLGDPDVRKLLEAKEAGEEVRLTVGKPKVTATEAVNQIEPSGEEVDAMSNSELRTHLEDRLVETLGGLLDEKISPLGEKLKGIEDDKHKQVVDARKVEWDEACKEYKDLEALKKEVVELDKASPNLAIKELYLIARERKGLGPPNGNSVLERPTASSRSTETKKRDEPLPPGVAGFRSVLDAAVNKGVDKALEGADFLLQEE